MAPPAPARNLHVTRVVDGDTIVVAGGETVRYIGIDTPEFGEPFFKEAKDENMRLVVGKLVKLVECRGEKRDKYGRTLAWVYADGVFVNGRLLKEGLARSLIIPPCGLERPDELKALEGEARNAGRGIWSQKGVASTIALTPEDAGLHIGERAVIRGRVFKVVRGRKAVFLGFGADRKRGFSAVIFRRYMKGFTSAGIDPADYRGKTVAVSGVIRRYGERLEIIVKWPGDIEVTAP